MNRQASQKEGSNVHSCLNPEIVDTFIAPPCDEQVEILFQDEHLLLINKPSGLLSLSGKNPLNQDSVHFRLVQQFPSARLLHRLDFGTSGIMLVALNKTINAQLTQQFQQRRVTKTYEAMLLGALPQDQGIIDQPIASDSALFPRMKICPCTGKPARTGYLVLERLSHPDRTRVQFTPETGRTHQLRIHSRELGHPILGCDLYGTEHSQALSTRLLLHAKTLAFTHPASGVWVQWESACLF